MWLDNDSPGCIYDTIDCDGCGGCGHDPTPLAIYCEEKYGDEEMTEEEEQEQLEKLLKKVKEKFKNKKYAFIFNKGATML